ncbi:cation:proton antiporter [Actinomyces howellii]|uniref:Sodium, potassium, lithium and rubidium/H(+) antiporter n=1 Tax=Actinomyces howellii TaxID=52771 RepID=A0A3S4UWE3_9ACTO|nr:cation:proton antiporter [Actinomyces howellii]VEG26809.1 Sodium, potassium, lithium and rubidium/H(+) antiporter [Actinomyces howellii]
MDLLVIAVVALLVIAACNQIAPRLGLASPLVLLGLGVAVGFLPMVGAIELDPEIVLEMVLPPLLFGAAVSMPVMDFRRELIAVAGLAVGLVVVTAVVLGLVVHTIVPDLPVAWAIALGAVLSPTDAVAVAIAKDLGVSHRIITILEGEGLFNDATALVLLSSATAVGLMTDTHALEPGSLVLDFVVALAVALLVGWVVGEVTTRVCARVSDPTANTVISFTIPFLASIPAEHLGGSGLVAAVVAGLVGSYRAPALVPPANRRTAQHNWRTVELVLEGGVFLTMGLQAYGIVEEVRQTTGGLAWAGLLALTAGALTVVLRAAFVVPLLAWLRSLGARSRRRYERAEERMSAFEQRLSHACDLDEEVIGARDLTPEEWKRALHRWSARLEHGRRKQRRARNDLDYFLNEPLGPREASVIIWAGMRGAVTLAAAQTLPLGTPMRPFLLLVALLVAAGSLVIQGLTLPALVRVARPQMAADGALEDERRRLVAVLGGALKDTALAQALSDRAGQLEVEPGGAGGITRSFSTVGRVLAHVDTARPRAEAPALTTTPLRRRRPAAPVTPTGPAVRTGQAAGGTWPR